MPAISPPAISNRIRLAYEVRAAIRLSLLVAEDGAVDAGLPLTGAFVDAVVEELPPGEDGSA